MKNYKKFLREILFTTLAIIGGFLIVTIVYFLTTILPFLIFILPIALAIKIHWSLIFTGLIIWYKLWQWVNSKWFIKFCSEYNI